MPTPGKNFPGQKGFPTPNSTPDDTVRRIFIVPNSDEWLGLLEGAAQVLLDEWRWYEWGACTPAEVVEAFNAIILASYTNLCPAELPGGGRILRTGYSGHFEELGDDGTWGEPSGDYTIPAVPARTDGSPTDQICLAAANAANVLQLLYENLSDSWNATLDTAEAQTAFLLGIGALIAAPFGLAAEAIVAIAGLVFQVAYQLLEFITADLWDENFTGNLKCILVDCATNDAGVVTFDLDCVNNALGAQVNLFSLTQEQLRLFGQIEWIFSMIGVDGLNSAGATTAITEATCDCCETPWCYGWDDVASMVLDGWSLAINIDSSKYWSYLPRTLELTAVSAEWTTTGDASDPASAFSLWHLSIDERFLQNAPLDTDPSPSTWTGDEVCGAFTVGVNTPSGLTFLTALQLSGNDCKPAWTHGHDC